MRRGIVGHVSLKKPDTATVCFDAQSLDNPLLKQMHLKSSTALIYCSPLINKPFSFQEIKSSLGFINPESALTLKVRFLELTGVLVSRWTGMPYAGLRFKTANPGHQTTAWYIGLGVKRHSYHPRFTHLHFGFLDTLHPQGQSLASPCFGLLGSHCRPESARSDSRAKRWLSRLSAWSERFGL